MVSGERSGDSTLRNLLDSPEFWEHEFINQVRNSGVGFDMIFSTKSEVAEFTKTLIQALFRNEVSDLLHQEYGYIVLWVILVLSVRSLGILDSGESTNQNVELDEDSLEIIIRFAKKYQNVWINQINSAENY